MKTRFSSTFHTGYNWLLAATLMDLAGTTTSRTPDEMRGFGHGVAEGKVLVPGKALVRLLDMGLKKEMWRRSFSRYSPSLGIIVGVSLHVFIFQRPPAFWAANLIPESVVKIRPDRRRHADQACRRCVRAELRYRDGWKPCYWLGICANDALLFTTEDFYGDALVCNLRRFSGPLISLAKPCQDELAHGQ